MGGNTPFTVDAATLHNAAKDVRSTRADVDGDIKKLSSLVGEIGSQWQGQAAGAFQRLMGKWSGDVNNLLTALDNIADLLDKSGTQHQATDEEQNNMFNKFDSALNS